MSIKLEIFADTVADFHAQLAGLLAGVPSYPLREDNPTWTAEDFARARPGAEVLPAEVVDSLLPQEEPQRRMRRTKAQIEADNTAASGTSASGDQTSTQDEPAGDDSGQTAPQTAFHSDGATGKPTTAQLADPEHPYNVHIKPAVLKLSAKGGRPMVEAFLAPYKADNARDIPQEAYPNLLMQIAKLLED